MSDLRALIHGSIKLVIKSNIIHLCTFPIEPIFQKISHFRRGQEYVYLQYSSTFKHILKLKRGIVQVG